MIDEWQRFDKKLAEITDVERTVYARPPEGVFSEGFDLLAQIMQHRKK